MLSQTTFEQFKAAVAEAKAAGKRVVTVVREILGDLLTPVMAYQKLKNGLGCALLESVSGGKHQGRYSIVATDPFLKFTAKSGRAEAGWLNHRFLSGQEPRIRTSAEPLVFLQELLAAYSPKNTQPFFTGGALGYIGHEAIELLEPTVMRNGNDDLGLPDIILMFFERVLVFDHATQGLHLMLNIPIGCFEPPDFEVWYQRVIERFDQLCRELAGEYLERYVLPPLEINIVSNTDQAEYEAMVVAAKEHIANGDVFQVVLSQRFETLFPAYYGLDFYRLLRRANPSPYLFHLDFGLGIGDLVSSGNFICLVGASPEVMVNIHNRDILLRPLAGTRKRKRGATAEEDAALAEELANDSKDQAEHRMLVDLGRNDVGRFAEPGSVKVEGLMRVETYGAVLHMATDVRGRLKSGVSSFEAMLGCLPAGTLSGAPKIRALRLIAELEPCQRGPYGGAVGWFTDTDLDTCIMIRSAVIHNQKLYFQTGAGIVADSVPAREYKETLAKSQSIRRVLMQMAGEK